MNLGHKRDTGHLIHRPAGSPIFTVNGSERLPKTNPVNDFVFGQALEMLSPLSAKPADNASAAPIAAAGGVFVITHREGR